MRLVFLTILLFLSGISVAQDSAAKFNFGVILPLSGPISEFGIALQRGIQMAREDNPQIDQRINFFIDDSRYDPSAAISILRKYRDHDKVQLTYNWGGNTSGGLVPVAEQMKAPLLVWAADPKLTIGKQFTVRLINPATDFAKKLWQHLIKNNKKKTRVYTTQNAYIEAMVEALVATKPVGVELKVDQPIPFEMTDMRSLVTQLRGADYDAVGVYLGGSQIDSFYKEVRNQKMSLYTFGTDFFESESQAKLAGSAINGAVYANHPVNADLAKRYLKKFGDDVQMPSACLGYDLAQFVAELFSDSLAPTLSSAEILARIKDKNKEYTGVTGKYHFVQGSNGDNYYEFPLVMREIIDLKPSNAN